MSFPTALSSGAITTLSNMQFANNAYVLIWGGFNTEDIIVFKARVNQAVVTSSLATIVFDTITKGAYTDALEGYTIYLSSSDDIRSAYWWGRLRKDTTTTTLNIEFSDVNVADDDYIFVTNDTRESIKKPRFNSSNNLVFDYDISYRAPPPTVYNMSSDYFAQIDADGNADVVLFAPQAQAIAQGATISSWAWSADGGSFIVGGASSQNVQIRYTTPGYYRPRVTVTDSNGNTSWFSPFVYIADNELKSVVNLRFEDIDVNADLQSGWNATIPFYNGVQNVLDHTQCAIYIPHKTSGNKIIFSGRIQSETPNFAPDGIGIVSFNLIGIASQMSLMEATEWRFSNTSGTPSDGREIKNVTPWRFAGNYIREMTNINNTHSIYFDDTSEDYIFISYYTQKGSVLDALRTQLWSTNEDLEFSSDGMIRQSRNLLYESDANRNAATTIATFDFDNYLVELITAPAYTLQHSHTSSVNKVILGAGWYDTTADDATIILGVSPAAVTSRGVEQSTLDRQILAKNQTRANAESELTQRTKNHLAASQQIDTLSIRLPGAFVGKLNPSISAWYKHVITLQETIRRQSYDTNTRWLLTDLSIGSDIETGQLFLDATFQVETQDAGFKMVIKNPPPKQYYNNPVLPTMNAYPTLPQSTANNFPTGAADGDEQPVDKDDTDPQSGAKDPAVTARIDGSGSRAVVWTDTTATYVENIGTPKALKFTDITPPIAGGQTIQQFVWNRRATSGKAGYLITNNGNISSPDTRVYRNDDIGTNALWLETTLDDMLGSQVRTINDTTMCVYGKFETFAPAGGSPLNGLTYYGGTDDMDGDGSSDLLPSTYVSAGVANPTTYAGVYNTSLALFNGGTGDNGGAACDIEWQIPPGITITSISLRGTYTKPIGSSTDGITEAAIIESEKGRHGTLTTFAFGTNQNFLVSDSANMPINAGEAENLYFQIAINRKPSQGAAANITGISISFTAESDWVGLRVSTDGAQTFDERKGAGAMTLNGGSMGKDELKSPLVAYELSGDGNVAYWPAITEFAKFQAPQDDTTGQFAKALWRFGRSDVDYLLAPDGGSVGLYKIINDVRTDITPNDGSNGIAIGVGALAMTPADTANNLAWMLADFGGTRKLAYTSNLSDTTTWAFNTSVTANATWVDVNKFATNQVYVTDGSNILYSNDSGVTFTSLAGPASSLKGISVL